MMKPLRLVTSLPYVLTILCLPLFNSVVTAQQQNCRLNSATGQITDLEASCKRREEQNLRIGTIGMDIQNLYKQGMKRAQGGLYQEAMADFNQVIQLKPDLAEAYVWRSYLRRTTGNLQGTIEDFQKAADIYRARGEEKRADTMEQQLQGLKQEL